MGRRVCIVPSSVVSPHSQYISAPKFVIAKNLPFGDQPSIYGVHEFIQEKLVGY